MMVENYLLRALPRIRRWCFAGLVLLQLSVPSAGAAPSSSFEKLATPLVESIRKLARKDLGKNRIAVLEFVNRQDDPSELSRVFADQLQEALVAAAPQMNFVERRRVADLMQQQGFPYLILRDHMPALWIGHLLGARYVVTGEYAVRGKTILLKARAWRVGDQKQIGAADVEIEDTTALAKMRNVLLDKETPVPGGAFVSGADGVTFPKCLDCPRPGYSEAAYKAKLQGTLLLWVLVGEDGIPRNVIIRRGLGLGLNEVSVAAVRTWRFAPPRDSVGRPVAAWCTAEMSFRVH